MNQMLQITGGGRAGLMNASWPFVKLIVTPDELTLKGGGFGKYNFAHSDVVALEPCGFIPAVGRGIRIVHRNRGYPNNVIFWCFFERPEVVIQRIRELGFEPDPTSGNGS